ncbi:MAG: DUF6152 family protein [Gammaproteobacteria bacterium]|jgi:hypothetical protein
MRNIHWTRWSPAPVAGCLAVALGGSVSPSQAHHSFAPHFDSSKPVEISGPIIEYEQRNPHAYLHVAATDENGLTREYVCESHGVTQLARNGITPEMLQPGVEVTLTGSQARRDPYMCFFNTVELADGRVFNVNGTREPARAAAEPQREDIFGTWLLAPANRSTSGPQPMMAALTEAGRRAVAGYDPFTDDPTFRCDPVAIRRVWFAPGTPLEITRDEDNIVLRFEWMDVERIVHLDQAAHPASGERTSLGHSIGHFEGETLIVETANYSEGLLRQYVETPGQPTRGMLHSDALTTTERIWFDAESNRLRLSIDHSDPVFFSRDFETVTAEYMPSDLVLEPFNCKPENPDQTLVE